MLTPRVQLTPQWPTWCVGRNILEELAVWAQAATPADVTHGRAVSRRALLAASAAALPVLLTGCKGIQALGTPPPPAPDIVALRSAISAERLLLTRYAAALNLLRSQSAQRATPQDVLLETAVEAVQVQHAAHLGQLRSRLVEAPGSAPAPSSSPTPSATTGLTGGVSAELTALEQAEQAASDRLIGQLAGLPPSLAQLFASIAASEATHVPFLQSARRRR